MNEMTIIERPSGSTIWRNGFAEDTMDKWCIWSKFGKRPVAFHNTREIAEAEAQRLAAKVRGSKFMVLHVVGKFSAAPLPCDSGSGSQSEDTAGG